MSTLSVWDNPDVQKLREVIDNDVVQMEMCLSNLQRHMLAMKVMSRKIARAASAEIERIVLVDDINERAQALAVVVAQDIGRVWEPHGK